MQNYQEGDLLLYNDQPLKLFGLDYTELVYVEKGSYMMGDFEKEIEFKTGYFMGKYPVTQQLYEAVIGENPSRFQGSYRPVERVSYNDICEGNNSFLAQLVEKIQTQYTDLSGEFGLPSEAQWEYAARGGKYWDKPKLTYAGSENLNDVGWYNENSNNQTVLVGLKQPNALNLYDMSGNIYEWCADRYVEDYQQIPKDGTLVTKNGTNRVLRGGSSFSYAEYCSVFYRSNRPTPSRTSDIGFRLVFSKLS